MDERMERLMYDAKFLDKGLTASEVLYEVGDIIAHYERLIAVHELHIKNLEEELEYVKDDLVLHKETIHTLMLEPEEATS